MDSKREQAIAQRVKEREQREFVNRLKRRGESEVYRRNELMVCNRELIADILRFKEKIFEIKYHSE